MATYEQIARLTVGQLMEEGDQAVTIDEAEAVRDAAGRLEESRAGAVVVQGKRGTLGIIESSDVSKAVAEGVDLATPARDLASLGPVTIFEDLPLEKVPDVAGSASTLVITDEHGSPKWVVRRDDLANRIKERFAS